MAKISISGYRTISTSSMQVGGEYLVWAHKSGCDPKNAKMVIVESRPSCPIRDMDENDAYVLRVMDDNGDPTDDVIRLVRNKCHPYYPVTPWTGKTGNPTTSRITVLEKE